MSSPETPKLSSALVCAAYHLCNEVRSLADMVGNDHKTGAAVFPHDVLADRTGQDRDACWSAVEAADRQGLIEYNPSLRTGLLTEKGVAILEQSGLNQAALCMPTIRRQGQDLEAAMLTAVNALTPEAQQRLAEDLAKDESGQGATSPRTSGPRH